MTRKVRVAVFVSGSGTNLQSLIDNCADELFPAEIVCVVSSKMKAYGLERARQHSIAAHCLRQKDFDNDELFGQAMLDLLHKHRIEMICLAGYLKLIPGRVVEKFRGRILNIHPALLPRFGGDGMYGMRVHEAVIASGETESGPTVHLVDEIYDNGDIVMQAKVPVMPDDTPESLQKRVLEAEHELYPLALKQLAENIISEEG
jgi:phosphoribosylglycinamide formyltransferase-1